MLKGAKSYLFLYFYTDFYSWWGQYIIARSDAIGMMEYWKNGIMGFEILKLRAIGSIRDLDK